MSNASEENTIICRCSDVTRAELEAWMERGLLTIDELKRMTRVTMGPCQGRTCRQLLLQELAAKTGKPLAKIVMPTFRQPLKGITLDAVAALNIEEEAESDEVRP